MLNKRGIQITVKVGKNPERFYRVGPNKCVGRNFLKKDKNLGAIFLCNFNLFKLDNNKRMKINEND